MPLGDSCHDDYGPFQKTIDESYGGDVDLFIADNRLYFEEYNREKCNWQDISLAATVFPELETDGKRAIVDMLGYLPPESVTMLHEPALRAIIHQERYGQISFTDYYDLAEETIKLIRNDDLRPHSLPRYHQGSFDAYHEQWNPYGQKAKDRITALLGYEPALEHSVMAENMLRSFFAASDLLQSTGLTEFDFIAVTVVKFREALTVDGIVAANASDLWGIELKYNFENKIINI